MDAATAFWHAVNFFAPVLGVATIGAVLVKLFWRRSAWRELALWGAVVGAVVWAACLFTFGQDGRMVSYAALVVAVAATFALRLPRN